MSDRAWMLEWLYLVNTALLATHEIDSAYWHEWRLFGMPGGIQLFLVLNFVLLLVVFRGLPELVRGKRAGSWFSLAVAGAGVLAVVLHGAFLLLGHPEFRLPVSLTILALLAPLSAMQAYLAVSTLRESPRGG